MNDPERLAPSEQRALDDASYREQLAYLLERSPFYRRKLARSDTGGGLEGIAALPLTEKAELKATSTTDNPFGAHLCVDPAELVRIYSTSGTTGSPSYIPLTAGDLDNWVAASARSYAASGIAAGDRVLTTYNAGPFVAGAALDAFERIGVTHIPVGTGTSERLLRAIEELADLRPSSVRRVLVAGEPGGSEPAFRAKLEDGWGARVTEAMGIGDVGPSLWGECEEQAGMHFGAVGLVHVELIDPETGASRELRDGATGELVLTHLRHRAAPVLRFRSRDHVELWTSSCRCGRTTPRVRCIGRTDDMLIVRGVNVFPSAVREVVASFAPGVSGRVLVRPRAPGVKQEPPLPIAVELGRDSSAGTALAGAIRARLREVLVVQADVELVPWGSLPRSEYKSRLVHR
jgi:phenylacetate-CoA ligase